MLWSEPEPSLPNNYGSALGALLDSALLIRTKTPKGPQIERNVSQSIDADVEKGFVKILNKLKARAAFGMEWYLPHHPLLNPNKPGIVRRVCNAATKYNDVCLNDKLLAGPDL